MPRPHIYHHRYIIVVLYKNSYNTPRPESAEPFNGTDGCVCFSPPEQIVMVPTEMKRFHFTPTDWNVGTIQQSETQRGVSRCVWMNTPQRRPRAAPWFPASGENALDSQLNHLHMKKNQTWISISPLSRVAFTVIIFCSAIKVGSSNNLHCSGDVSPVLQ